MATITVIDIGAVVNDGTGDPLRTAMDFVNTNFASLNSGKAESSVSISAGTGLTGGGSLAANRVIALSPASVASLALADSAVQPARLVSAGTGLTGGGNLGSDVTISLSAATIDTLNKIDATLSGPPSTLDNSIPRFDGVDGTNLQETAILIDDNQNLLVPGIVGTSITGALHVPSGNDAQRPTLNATDRAIRDNLSGGFEAWDGSNWVPFGQGLPPGSVIYVAMNAPPEGYVKANGAALSRTTYAELFASIGTNFGAGDGSTTFNIPDLRGEFIRGWDDARGIDSGRVFGSSQVGAIESHTHTGTAASAGAHSHTYSDRYHPVPRINEVNPGNDAASGSADLSRTTSSAGAHTHSLTIDATGGSETRPRNVALLACIKY